MGIEGLWQQIEPLQRKIHLRTLAKQQHGRPIGIDGDNFLHAIAGKHALELAQGRYDNLIEKAIRVLMGYQKRCGVSFIVVFDGEDPPMKAEEQRQRREKRDFYRGLGLELLRYGYVEDSEQLLKKAPPMSCALLAVSKALKTNGIEVIHAPMEAEAQLAYMNRHGDIGAVWSADSDSVAYYAKIVIRDIDPKTCMATAYFCDDMNSWGRCGALGQIHRVPLFMLCCVAAGSDYTTQKLGSLNSAAERIRSARTFPEGLSAVLQRLEGSPSASNRGGGSRMATVTAQTKDAVGAFLYHYVYDVRLRRIVHNYDPVPADELPIPSARVLGIPPQNAVEYCVSANSFDANDLPLVDRPDFQLFQFTFQVLPSGVDEEMLLTSPALAMSPATTAQRSPGFEEGASPALALVPPLSSCGSAEDLFEGPFDCPLCRVHSNSPECHQVHLRGIVHKGVVRIARERQSRYGSLEVTHAQMLEIPLTPVESPMLAAQEAIRKERQREREEEKRKVRALRQQEYYEQPLPQQQQQDSNHEQQQQKNASRTSGREWRVRSKKGGDQSQSQPQPYSQPYSQQYRYQPQPQQTQQWPPSSPPPSYSSHPPVASAGSGGGRRPRIGGAGTGTSASGGASGFGHGHVFIEEDD